MCETFNQIIIYDCNFVLGEPSAIRFCDEWMKINLFPDNKSNNRLIIITISDT